MDVQTPLNGHLAMLHGQHQEDASDEKSSVVTIAGLDPALNMIAVLDDSGSKQYHDPDDLFVLKKAGELYRNLENHAARLDSGDVKSLYSIALLQQYGMTASTQRSALKIVQNNRNLLSHSLDPVSKRLTPLIWHQLTGGRLSPVIATIKKDIEERMNAHILDGNSSGRLTDRVVMVDPRLWDAAGEPAGSIVTITSADLDLNEIVVRYDNGERGRYDTHALLGLKTSEQIYELLERDKEIIGTNDYSALFSIALLLEYGSLVTVRTALELAQQSQLVMDYSLSTLDDQLERGKTRHYVR